MIIRNLLILYLVGGGVSFGVDRIEDFGVLRIISLGVGYRLEFER